MKIDPRTIIGKHKGLFILESEVIAIAKHFGAESEDDFEKFFKWIKQYGGKRCDVIWKKTNVRMKCYLDLYLIDMRFETKIWEHWGQGVEFQTER